MTNGEVIVFLSLFNIKNLIQLNLICQQVGYILDIDFIVKYVGLCFSLKKKTILYCAIELDMVTLLTYRLKIHFVVTIIMK